MQDDNDKTPVRFRCVNCNHESVGWKGKDGLTRFKCPRCGTVTVSKVMTRRHIRLDVYAPEGQVALCTIK